MKYEVGQRYYTRNGVVAEVTGVSGTTVEGYLARPSGDSFTTWHGDGRRSLARRSPSDLTEVKVPPPVVVVKRGAIGTMAKTPAPSPVKGFVAEFVSNTSVYRYFSPVFETRFGLDRHVERKSRDGQTLIRITTVAEVPEGLSA